MAQGIKLTRFEWGLIRQKLGKQRRYAPKFLAGERDKLHQERTRYRQKHEQVKLRRNSIHQSSNTQNHVESEETTKKNCINNNDAGTTTVDLEAMSVGNRMVVGDRVQVWRSDLSSWRFTDKADTALFFWLLLSGNSPRRQGTYAWKGFDRW